MIRYVSLTWNIVFVVLAFLWVFLSYKGSIQVEQIIAEYEGTFSDAERNFSVLLSTAIGWLMLLVIWAIGAFILWPFKSAARRNSGNLHKLGNGRQRHEPKF